MRTKIKSLQCHHQPYYSRREQYFFLASEYIVTVPPPPNSFSDNSLEESLWSKPSTEVVSKSHSTGRCLASQICHKQTILYQMLSSMFGAITNLVFRGNECRIIQEDVSDCKGLKERSHRQQQIVGFLDHEETFLSSLFFRRWGSCKNLVRGNGLLHAVKEAVYYILKPSEFIINLIVFYIDMRQSTVNITFLYPTINYNLP